MQKYHFVEKVDYEEACLIAKIQFKKNIINFKQEEFKKNFYRLFYEKKAAKLFLKKEKKIICGVLAEIYQNKLLIDIFFWNSIFQKHNIKTTKMFFKEFVKMHSSEDIKHLIIPLQKNRKKFNQFKKTNQKFFKFIEPLDEKDKNIKKWYSNHFLLKINCKLFCEEQISCK